MRKESCKHFTGYQNGTCKLGVNYRQLVGGPDIGWAARLPCTSKTSLDKEPMAICDKREEPTEAEIMAEKLEMKTRSEKVVEAIRRIRATGKNQGAVLCPQCDVVDALNFSVAKLNGHIWGKCKTSGCLAWMM